MKITEDSLKEQEATQAASGEVIREAPPSEREKLKSMSGKDRLWYIWAYYKFHIASVFVVIGIIWAIGSAMYQKTFETAFYCVYLNNRSETELDTSPLEQGFREYMGFGEKQLINTESTYISYGEEASEFSYASMAKISALVAARELDIMIGDQENMKHYASMDGMTDLEAGLPADTLALIRDRLIYSPGADGSERAYGVSLEGTWFAEESHLAQDPPILGILSNSTHKDTVIAFLHYIFAQ